MKRIELWLILALLSLSSDTIGQWCATEFSEPDWSYEDLAPYYTNGRSLGVDSIGVAVHLITDGLTPVTFQEVQKEIDAVNALFQEIDVFFFICSFGEHYGVNRYTADEMAVLNSELHIERLINLYIPRKFTAVGNFELCGQAIFPWIDQPEDRYIVVSRKCLDNGSTLTHEFGHFLGLLHTHESSNGIEYVNGSNCTIAGDLLCDTPADPNLFGSVIDSNCNYLGSDLDPLNELYKPDPSFIMSYARKDCRRRFSDDQYAVMRLNKDQIKIFYEDDCSSLPDLALKSAFTPDTLGFHENIEIDFEVTSTLPIESEYSISATLTNERFVNPEPERIIQLQGRRHEGILSFPIPEGLSPGRYFVTVEVDREQQHSESNEHNNRRTFEFVFERPTRAQVFPNPTNSILHYSADLQGLQGEHAIRLYNIAGQVIYFEQVESNPELIYGSIDVSKYSAGTYILEIVLPAGDPLRFKFVIAG